MNFALSPGAEHSPVILHVPHSSREIPPEVRSGIVLDDPALARELDHITDSHTALLAAEAAEVCAVRPWVFTNRLSRLVVDPERFPDEREEMLAVGMGAVYTRTTHKGVLRAADTDPELCLLMCIRDRHSYPSAPLPYELHGDGPRPPVCLGTDSFHTPPGLLAAARKAFEECGEVGLDSPFGGTYVPLEFYGTDPRVGALMVEIRRDTYLTEPGGPAGPGLLRLAEALARLVDALPG